MAPRPHPPGVDPTINHAEPEPVASPPLPPGLAPTTVQRGPGELPKVLDEGQPATPLVPANPAAPPAHLAGAYPFLSPTDRTEELGRLGPYRVVKLLGAGGMGFVFLAEDEGLLRPVALKVMRPEVAAEPTARERFLREGRAVANIRSDHVITIHQVGEANGAPFLAMEYLEGLTLDDWLKAWSTPRQRPVTATAVIRVAKDVLKGLVAAHAKGLIHRDIKPANLWVEAQTSRVKLLDFGLTRGGDSDEGLTRTGQILGTPAYMAPEQARGLPVDARADLFSVGVVLYRMLAGKNPFQRDSMFATLTSLAVDDPPPAASFGVVPAELATLIDRLMAKSPDRRPATAREAFSVVLAIENQVRAARAAPSATVPKPKTSVAPQQTDVVTDVVEYWGEYRTGPRETPDRAEIDLEIEPEPPGLESGHNLRTGSRGSTSESNDQKTPRVPVAEATARPSITRSFTPLPSHPTPGSVGRPLPVSGPFPHVRPRALPPDGGLPRPSKWQTLPRLWLLALVAVVLLMVALVGLAIGLGGGAVIKRLRNAQINCVEPGGYCVTTAQSDTRSGARITS